MGTGRILGPVVGVGIGCLGTLLCLQLLFHSAPQSLQRLSQLPLPCIQDPYAPHRKCIHDALAYLPTDRWRTTA